jgi:hypothetical protein
MAPHASRSYPATIEPDMSINSCRVEVPGNPNVINRYYLTPGRARAKGED